MTFNGETFGGVRIYRPNLDTEWAVRHEAEAGLRHSFSAGLYSKRDDINAVLQKHFCFYDGMLKRLIPEIASRHLMEFVLTQYDLASAIHWKNERCEIIDLDPRSRWKELGPNFRRAAKYIAECISMLAPGEAPNAELNQVVELIDRSWICAEQMVYLSNLSTQTFAIFPDATTLEIRPEGDQEWFRLSIRDAEKFEAHRERLERDTASRKEVIDEHKTLYDRERLSRLVDPAFKNEFGITLTDVLEFAFSVAKNADPHDQGFDVSFVQEQKFLDSLVATKGLSASQTKLIVDGLCLRKSKLLAEGRVVWNPKQEYRAYSRPFFEFPHESGTHFTWSRKMAEECLFTLYTRLAQKLLPVEWNAGGMAQALGGYEQEITTLFENIVIDRVKEQGIAASRFKRQIGVGASAIKIPDNIGEIDLLAYWPEENLVIVGDNKLVKPTHDPKTHRDDIGKFVESKKNYVDQVNRKMQWVIDNIRQIEAALGSVPEFPKSVTAKGVAPVLVTYYPAFASYFISDLPCVALTELIAALKRKQGWPYSPVHAVDEEEADG